MHLTINLWPLRPRQQLIMVKNKSNSLWFDFWDTRNKLWYNFHLKEFMKLIKQILTKTRLGVYFIPLNLVNHWSLPEKMIEAFCFSTFVFHRWTRNLILDKKTHSIFLDVQEFLINIQNPHNIIHWNLIVDKKTHTSIFLLV